MPWSMLMGPTARLPDGGGDLRGRLCIRCGKGFTIHLDLEDVVRIQFQESVEKKALEIEKEITAAGLI